MMKPFDGFRTIQNYWISDNWLKNRMLFLSGPRQVGKTTLVTSTLCQKNAGYFNWDSRKVRMAYQKDPDFFSSPEQTWICFDEIHKRPKWKDILKGAYDDYRDKHRFVITGSARLEMFKRSGDSLVGRYFHTHLFPINIPDLCQTDFQIPENAEDLAQLAASSPDMKEVDDLLALGGFPEPFFSGSDRFWKRWSLNHHDLIVQEDLKDLTRVIEIDKITALLEMIKPSVGSTISLRHLANDLETTHGSIQRWLQNLNKVHLIFPVAPYTKNVRRTYRQVKKWYFMDWRFADDNRFENLVAASLFRAAVLYTDRFGEHFDLHFVRTHDQTEVDFLLTKNKKPWLLIEAKEGAPEITRGVHRFSSEFGVPCFVVTRKHGIFKKEKAETTVPIYRISWSKLARCLP
jgi:uncharacterized protein